MSKRVFCPYPWTNLAMYPTSNEFAFCCNGRFKIPSGKLPKNREEVMELYNSPIVKHYRKALVTGNLKGTRCERCHHFVMGNKDVDKPVDLTGIYTLPDGVKLASKNRERVEELYLEGALETDSTPLVMNFVHSDQCNLRCIMCTQSHKEAPLPDEVLGNIFSMLEDIGFDSLAWLGFNGGEILYAEDGVKILDYLSKVAPKNTILDVYSNGMLLDEQIDKLSKLHRLAFSISVDGYGKALEHIRRGGSWEKLEGNLELFDKAREGKDGWVLMFHTMICLTSIKSGSLKKVAEVAKKYKATLRYYQLEGWLPKENVYIFPWLMDDFDWRKEFDDAEEEAKDMPNMTALHSLQQIRHLLDDETGFSEWKINYLYERYHYFGHNLTITQREQFYKHAHKWEERAEKILAHIKEHPEDGDLGEWEVLNMLIKNIKGSVDRVEEMKEKIMQSASKIDEIFGGEEFIIFGVSFVAENMLDFNKRFKLGIKASALTDHDQTKIGRVVGGVPVVKIEEIGKYGSNVLILSKKFEDVMRNAVKEAYGDSMKVELLELY